MAAILSRPQCVKMGNCHTWKDGLYIKTQPWRHGDDDQDQILYIHGTGTFKDKYMEWLLYSRFTFVFPSVRPSVDGIVCALYLQQCLPDLFHIYTFYQATAEDVSHVKIISKIKNLRFWQILKICNYDFVLFWLRVQCESIVWVIMGWWGYLWTQAF